MRCHSEALEEWAMAFTRMFRELLRRSPMDNLKPVLISMTGFKKKTLSSHYLHNRK